MRVESLLSAARERLTTIDEDAPLITAERLHRSGTDFLLVCDPEGTLRGVTTKTDVVAQFSQCQGSGCLALASGAMIQDDMVCGFDDVLEDLWVSMRERGLKNVPVVDLNAHPLECLTRETCFRPSRNPTARKR